MRFCGPTARQTERRFRLRVPHRSGHVCAPARVAPARGGATAAAACFGSKSSRVQVWLELRLIFLGALVVVCCVRLRATFTLWHGDAMAAATRLQPLRLPRVLPPFASASLRRARWPQIDRGRRGRDCGGFREATTSGPHCRRYRSQRCAARRRRPPRALRWRTPCAMACACGHRVRRMRAIGASPCSYALNIVVNLNMSVRGGVFGPFPSRRPGFAAAGAAQLRLRSALV